MTQKEPPGARGGLRGALSVGPALQHNVRLVGDVALRRLDMDDLGVIGEQQAVERVQRRLEQVVNVAAARRPRRPTPSG